MIASISLSMVPTLNYRMEQPGGSVRDVLAGILKRNLYEIVHIEYCPIQGVSVFVTFVPLKLWILSTFLCTDFGNSGRSLFVRNFGPQ